MLSAKIKDLKIRQKFYNAEINKNISKFLFINILNNKALSANLKKKAHVFIVNLLNKRYSKTRIIRRCSLVNRGRVSDRKLGISRIKLREMLKSGVVPGYSKAIW
jgi:ribosomal protein S14